MNAFHAIRPTVPVLAMLLAATPVRAAESATPNIVFILADDLG